VAFRSLPDMEREPVADPLLMERLGQAEKETADLQKELAELDEQWARKLSELKDSAASGDPADLEVANVISLANRIRNLKRDLSTG
jgi:hypothetical protein